MEYNSLTERILLLCYKLEHFAFLTDADRKKFEKELKELVEKRNILLNTLKIDKDNK